MSGVVYIIALIILVFYKPERYSEFDLLYNFYLSMTFFVLSFVFLIENRAKNKNWLRFDVLFLIGFAIVHFQIPFLASMGIEPTRPNLVWINKNIVNFATWMSLVAITLWMFGYTIMNNKKQAYYQDNRLTFKVNLRIYDSVLLFILIIFMGLVGPQFFAGVYDGGRSYGEGANYAELFLRTSLYLRIIYFFKDIPKYSNLKHILARALNQRLFIIILITYVLLFLRVGDRGPILQVALLLAGNYVIFIRPLSWKKVMFFIFIGSIFFTILKMGRGRDSQTFSNQNIIERGITDMQSSEDDINFTEELASSIRVQYRALDIVPAKHPYLNGISFFAMGVGVIPFSSQLIMEPLGVPYWYHASSTFLNVETKGHNYSSGDGSEILADIYVNFGLYGTFLVMFLFGIFSGYVYNKALMMNFTFIIILLVFIYNGLYINRAMLLTPLKDITYILFINFLFSKIIK